MKNLMLLTLTCAALTVGCQNGTNIKSSTSPNALNLNSQVNPQAPLVSLKIMDGTSEVGTYNTIAGNNQAGQNPAASDTLKFDFSASTDPQGSALSFQISINGGAPIAVSGTSYSQSFASPGTIPVVVTATNAKGLSSSVNLNLLVQCSAAMKASLALNAAKVTVAPSAVAPNLFNFSAAGAASGGSGKYNYSWDFNGDQRYDDYTVANPQIWNASATATNVYSIFASTRQPSLMVEDTVCNTTVAATISYDFDSNIPRLPASTSLAPVEGYYYVQADIAGLNGNADPADNASYMATQETATPDEIHVRCDYNHNVGGSGFTIKGLNNYQDSTLSDATTHGLSLNVINIADNGGAGLQSFSSSTSSVAISGIDWLSSESSDGAVSNDFAMASTCKIAIHVQRAVAAATCSTGSGFQSEVVTITGEFSCPVLQASNAKQVSAKNGLFYCQVSTADQCVGGGQEGGNPPPLQ